MADGGPMRLVIGAWKEGQARTEAALAAAETAFDYLARIARFRKMLSLPAGRIQEKPEDEIARRMLRSVRRIGDADLTPMAAVAGTLADFVADGLLERGMTKVVVDNGGDVAVRLSGNESVTIGIRPDIRQQEISHVLRLDARLPSWGIATSGLGGRSFTRGIASAVTTISREASMADAAATAIANVCFVVDDRIVQVPAEDLDPNTDLMGIPVTVRVGSLSPEKVAMAVQNALLKAEALKKAGAIIGALIACQKIFAVTEGFHELTISSPLCKRGDA